MKAVWKGETIASSGDTVEVEGNHYFPAESVNKKYLTASSKTTVCPWKGTAHYYGLAVGDDVNEDAAWYYPDPKEAAENIRERVAFWRGVEVQEGS